MLQNFLALCQRTPPEVVRAVHNKHFADLSWSKSKLVSGVSEKRLKFFQNKMDWFIPIVELHDSDGTVVGAKWQNFPSAVRSYRDSLIQSGQYRDVYGGMDVYALYVDKTPVRGGPVAGGFFLSPSSKGDGEDIAKCSSLPMTTVYLRLCNAAGGITADAETAILLAAVLFPDSRIGLGRLWEFLGSDLLHLFTYCQQPSEHRCLLYIFDGAAKSAMCGCSVTACEHCSLPWEDITKGADSSNFVLSPIDYPWISGF